jgi:CheY-like chemotaxis protein
VRTLDHPSAFDAIAVQAGGLMVARRPEKWITLTVVRLYVVYALCHARAPIIQMQGAELVSRLRQIPLGVPTPATIVTARERTATSFLRLSHPLFLFLSEFGCVDGRVQFAVSGGRKRHTSGVAAKAQGSVRHNRTSQKQRR